MEHDINTCNCENCFRKWKYQQELKQKEERRIQKQRDNIADSIIDAYSWPLRKR